MAISISQSIHQQTWAEGSFEKFRKPTKRERFLEEIGPSRAKR